MSENYDKIIKLAWHDKTSFDEIKSEKGMNISDEKFYIKDISVDKVLNQIKNIIKI